jgi:hypothetical protein
MSRTSSARIAAVVVGSLALTLVLPQAATAEPVVILQHDDEHLSITVERDGSTVQISATNVGDETEHLGLGAYLSGAPEQDLLWQAGPFADQFRADIEPGAQHVIDAPFWPGTLATFYREIDTTPQPLTSFQTDGDWVQLVMSGTAEEPRFRLGSNLEWQDDVVVPGEGVLVTATEVPASGAVDVVVSSDSTIDIVGDQLVLVPGTSARTIGTATISAIVDGEGYRVGFSVVGEVPVDLPTGEYQVFLVQNGIPLPSYSDRRLLVESGTPAPATAGTVAITGRARLHDTLTAVTSGWDPEATLVYQWYADGAPIERGIDPTLVLDYYENGRAVTVGVSAWRDGFAPAAALSAPTAPVAHHFFTDTPAPTFTGSLVVGERLVAVAPVWTPTTGFDYEWFVDYQSTGVTTRGYTIQPADAGKPIAVLVKSLRLGYHDTAAFSDWSAPVAAGTLTPPARADRPAITGNVQVGKTLTLRTGGWRPAPGYAFEWFIGGVPVPGAGEQTFTVPGEFGGESTVGKSVTARLTVSSAGYQPVVVDLAAVDPISVGQFSKGAPWFSPTQPLTVGLTLTAQPGSWYPVGDYTYEWIIGGVVRGTGETFVIPADAVGKRIKITTFATAIGYEPAQRSWLSDTAVLP